MYEGERFNSISHLIGAVAALAGLIVVVVIAAQQGDLWKIISFSIYGTTLFLLYTISTLYHSLRGRLVLVALKPLLEALPLAGFIGLLLGGIFYTGGIVFYLFDEKVRHFHGIWHLFVLAGSVSHYLTILLYVA